jgi:hypothetical protein
MQAPWVADEPSLQISLQGFMDWAASQDHLQTSRYELLISTLAHAATNHNLAIADRGDHIQVLVNMSMLVAVSVSSMMGLFKLCFTHYLTVFDGEDSILIGHTKVTAECLAIPRHGCNFNRVHSLANHNIAPAKLQTTLPRHLIRQAKYAIDLRTVESNHDPSTNVNHWDALLTAASYHIASCGRIARDVHIPKSTPRWRRYCLA